jgi:hypothetical protein
MISHQHKCIFIHIPKCAGTSIEKKLGHFDELKRGVQDHSTIKEVETNSICLLSKYKIQGRYLSNFKFKELNEFKAKCITTRQYNSYYKFTFVRNTWSRLYSWYRNVMRDEHHLKRYGIENQISFEDFLKRYYGSREMRSQLFWMLDVGGKIPFDFIGRFEKLEKDFAFVASELNINDASLPKLLHTALHKTHVTESYIDYYDEKLKDLVFKLYRDEITQFKFEFGE